ncbi:hypothetical protein COCNU_scaffold014723G000010 [Cocos nucifera]|nr:hypothetical protein [Cocos nucifera]
MAPNSTILSSLKLAIILVLSAWICIWILRPTQLWKKSWHVAEDLANATSLGDYGLNVVVFCFPVLAVATLGYIYLHLCVNKGRLRQRISWMTNFSCPLIISSPVGILSGGELLLAALFILFLVWTYYSNVSGDFKKTPPYKPLQLNRWQLKMMRLGIRIGSLSEACLALLLLPILRGMAVFRISGIQFEASVSIISSSNMDDDRFSVLVKCQGQWTNALYDMVNLMADGGSGNMKNLSAAVEGPYGPAAFPHQRYDSLVLVAGGSGITPFLSILQDAASRSGNISKYPTKIQLIYVVKRLKDLSMLTPISPLLINQSGELGHLKLKVFVTQEEGTTTIVREMFNDLSQVKTVIMDRNSSEDIVARPEGLLWKATITMLSFLTFLASLVFLSHIFIHQGKKSSENKYPSWVSDLLVFCSFAIATSCCSLATVLLRWRKSVNNIQLLSQKYTESAEMQSLQLKGALEEHEITFGRRPKLIDILSELSAKMEESKVGVFVCGPDSMQKSVATFCRAYLQKSNFNYHSVNFSL